MDFDDYLRSTTSDLNYKETVGLAIYYLKEEENVEVIHAKDAQRVIKHSESTVPTKSVPAYPSRLAEDNLLKKVNSGYSLTNKGRNYFESRIDLPKVEDIREGLFLDVNSPDDNFFSPLVEDINKCYQAGVDEGATVLTRKLLENLLVEIMRTHMGVGDSLELYYIEDERRFKPFSTIVDNFEENIEEFQPFSPKLDSEFIDTLTEFREQANAAAHSLEIDISESEMNKLSKDGTELVKVLFKVREEVRYTSQD